eukprot:gene3901-962_t
MGLSVSSQLRTPSSPSEKRHGSGAASSTSTSSACYAVLGPVVNWAHTLERVATSWDLRDRTLCDNGLHAATSTHHDSLFFFAVPHRAVFKKVSADPTRLWALCAEDAPERAQVNAATECYLAGRFAEAGKVLSCDGPPSLFDAVEGSPSHLANLLRLIDDRVREGAASDGDAPEPVQVSELHIDEPQRTAMRAAFDAADTRGAAAQIIEAERAAQAEAHQQRVEKRRQEIAARKPAAEACSPPVLPADLAAPEAGGSEGDTASSLLPTTAAASPPAAVVTQQQLQSTEAHQAEKREELPQSKSTAEMSPASQEGESTSAMLQPASARPKPPLHGEGKKQHGDPRPDEKDRAPTCGPHEHNTHAEEVEVEEAAPEPCRFSDGLDGVRSCDDTLSPIPPDYVHPLRLKDGVTAVSAVREW